MTEAIVVRPFGPGDDAEWRELSKGPLTLPAGGLRCGHG